MPRFVVFSSSYFEECILLTTTTCILPNKRLPHIYFPMCINIMLLCFIVNLLIYLFTTNFTLLDIGLGLGRSYNIALPQQTTRMHIILHLFH